jgi:hypothetical protein
MFTAALCITLRSVPARRPGRGRAGRPGGMLRWAAAYAQVFHMGCYAPAENARLQAPWPGFTGW